MTSVVTGALLQVLYPSILSASTAQAVPLSPSRLPAPRGISLQLAEMQSRSPSGFETVPSLSPATVLAPF